MRIRSTCAVAMLLLLAVLAGCDDEKGSAPAAGGETAAQPASATPSADPAAALAPSGEAGAPAGDPSAPADPAKVEEAANTALKVMVAVSSAVRGAKGDCARMQQNLTGVKTVAQKWRDQLAEQYKSPGVRQGVREGVAFGKFKELTMNLMATRDGARTCPDVAPELDEIRTEVDGSAPGARAP